MALLVVVIGGILVIGDNVGVRVERFSPAGQGSQSSLITMNFSEDMDRSSVENRFTVEPQVEGEFTWSGPRMIFRPTTRLVSGTTYRVHLDSGSKSLNGREALKDFSFSFDVRGARIAYALLGDEGHNDVWISDPSDPEGAERLTFSQYGVSDFTVSPDGGKLAYIEVASNDNSDTSTSLKMLDIETGVVSDLIPFGESHVSEPAWSSDSSKIAYTRVDFSTSVPGIDDGGSLGYSLPRVWIVDISQSPPASERALSSSAGSSFAPVWSTTGDVLAVGNDPLTEGSVRRIAVSNRATDDVFYLDTILNSVVSFNGNGDEVLFIVNTSSQFNAPTELWVSFVGSQLLRKVKTGSDEPVRDSDVAWQPGGEWVAVSRRGFGENETRGNQAFLVNIVTGDSRPIAYSVEHSVESLTWSPSGDSLAIVRLRRWEADGETHTSDTYRDLLIYSPQTGELTEVTRGASKPSWAP